MRVVVDANIVVSALLQPEGWTAKRLQGRAIAFLVPGFVLEEIAAHESEFCRRTELTNIEWKNRVRQLFERIEILPEPALDAVGHHALVLQAEAVDAKDAAYVAAFVAGQANLIWTRDKALIAALPQIASARLPIQS